MLGDPFFCHVCHVILVSYIKEEEIGISTMYESWKETFKLIFQENDFPFLYIGHSVGLKTHPKFDIISAMNDIMSLVHHTCFARLSPEKRRNTGDKPGREDRDIDHTLV